MDINDVRAWAEEQEPGVILLTWEWTEGTENRDPAADRRAVASALSVRQRIKSAKPSGNGVLVRYNAEEIDKKEIAELLRATLAVEDDLKSRSNEMLRRVPTYLNLAQKLGRDERISPLPGAAREMSYRRGGPVKAAPLQMVPGFRLISRLHTILPVLQSLASWSRTAPPEVVENHLSSAGLSREQLDLDHATAHEMMLFAREYSSEKAGEIGRKAGELTSQATTIGREWIRKAQEKRQATDKP
ncbi:MAG: hypothetical protein H0V47_14445 [Chloroflexia bacterium]|nr:hypothetical protein [Chloroflexia bacterium]